MAGNDDGDLSPSTDPGSKERNNATPGLELTPAPHHWLVRVVSEQRLSMAMQLWPEVRDQLLAAR